MRPVAVFDTNVLVSATGWKGTPFECVELARAGTVEGMTCRVSIPGTLKVVAADPDDDKILECAEVGGATHVVTGDRRHLLPLGSFKRIAIVSAADFLALVRQP